MVRQGQWLGVGLIGMSGWLIAGCASLPDYAMPTRSLADNISEPPPARVVRPQMSDGPGVVLQKPTIPPPEPKDPPMALPTSPPPGTGAVQTSYANRGSVRVSVRAWVNNRPIFDEEIRQLGGPQLEQMNSLPDAERSEKMTKFYNDILEQIIEQELMFQDAVKKLEKLNPTALEKMKGYVDHEFDKSVDRMRKANYSEARIREIEPVARRMMERNLISTEYARSRIMPILQSMVGLAEIREYYSAHKDEFQAVDRVEWQDIFIPLGDKQTIEEAKRFGEELIKRCRAPGDFERLMVYNEGDSKLRGGEGLGQKKGEIRPLELEEHLFKLDERQIGPVVAFSTGIHLFRVTKREYAGQLPPDEKVQKIIRKKLESQLADREYRRIVRELRQRAVTRIERETP